MKLQQINEMFEDAKLGPDVQVSHIDKRHTYKKYIDGDEYFVGIQQTNVELSNGDDVMAENITEALNGIWGIVLKGPDGYSTTGKGNFAAVYGFLIAALRDTIVNYNINALYFSGANPGMDIVYRRFINTFKKIDNPAFQFHNMGNDIWISEHGLQLLNTDDAVMLKSSVNKNDETHDAEMRKSRIIKNNSRKYKHILNKTAILYNGEEYNITRVDVDGNIIGYSNDGIRQVFSPEMIPQLEIV